MNSTIRQIIYQLLTAFPTGCRTRYNRQDEAATLLFTNREKACSRQKLPKTSAPLWTVVLGSLLGFKASGQIPVITSFSPTAGPVGTTITINGSNFNTSPAANVVYFGAVKAAVTGASPTSLTVTAPAGATYKPLTVTTGNLTAYASSPFAISFSSNPAGITANSFAPKVDYFPGSNPANIAISDLDGDGKADMISANTSSNTVSVFRNTGSSGTISFTAKVDYATNTSPTNVAVGDLDGDGKPDLVVVNSSQGTISVFKNTSVTGAVSFAPKLDYTGGSGLNNIAIGDLNSDGKPDLVVGSSGTASIYIFKNTSTGGAISFNSAVYIFSTINNNRNIAIYDLNGDGKPELISDDGYSFVCVLRNTTAAGTISFAAGMNFTTGTSNNSVGIADLDGDGKPDIAETTAGSGISVFRNTGTGGIISFAARVDFAGGFNPQALDMGDIDGDGKPDVAVTNSSDSAVSVLKNTSTVGTVSFAAKISYATRESPYGVAVADLDGDGKPDLATANRNYAASTISIIRNQTDGPNIASFTPTNAAAGSNIVITGTNLTGVAAVTIGGITATGFTVNSDVQITAVVPAVTGGAVVVTTPAGTAILGGFYNGPSITSVSPVTGPLGTTVTITGTAFNPDAAANIVYTGAVKAAVSAATATSLAITIPAGTTYQPITVTTGNRTAYSAQPFVVTFPSNAGGFTLNSFAAKVDYAAGRYGPGTSIGDLDGDGKAEMVIANPNSNSILVFKNGSTPGALSLANNVIPAVTGITSLALGDIDGDGKTDIVFTVSASNIVSVMKNTSTGGVISFAAKVDVATSSAGNLTVGDLDGDGKPDLAVSLSLYRNTSTGGSISFAAGVNLATGSSSGRVIISDIDGDGKADLATPNYYAGTVSVFRNTGSSGMLSFALPVDYATGDRPSNIAVGDMDGDGKPDLAVTNYGSGNVSVLRNTSTGGAVSFAHKTDYPTGSGPGSLSVSDLDGDGKPDLAVANADAFSFSVLKNTSATGTLSFSAAVNYTTGGSADFIATGDLDGDGKPDLIINNSGLSSASVFRNQTDGPDVYSFAPANAGPGTTLTINGTNFTGTTAVKLGGIAATSFTVVSNTVITAVVAAVAGGPVSVTTPKGIAARTGFYNGPVISSFSPVSGPVGTTVTINGSNFNTTPSANTVYFGAVKATVSAASAASLTVTVPVGATYQPLTVTANTLTAYAGQPFVVTPPFSNAGITSNSFAAKQDLSMAYNSNPNYVGSGDFDGDGKADLVMANYNNGSISVLRNTSTPGTVSFAPEVAFNSGYYMTSVAIGDFDGDGKADLAVIGTNSPSVYVYRNVSTAGTIAFATYVNLSTGTGNTPRSIAVGDLDGDGKPDLAVLSAYYLHLFKNSGSPGTLSFAERTDYPGGGGLPRSVAIGDIDGDGKPDLAVTNYTYTLNAFTVSVFKNGSNSGVLAIESEKALITIDNPYGLGIGDLDGDGKADLAVTNYYANTISVWRNTSTGGTVSFAAKINYPAGTGPYAASLTDLDGDAKPDLVVPNAGAGTVSVFKNASTSGTLSFLAKVDYTTGAMPQSVSIGDLDGDGKPDLAVANTGSNTVSVLRNQFGAPFIASFSPANAAVGTMVTVDGSSFTGATAVSIGGIAASSFTVVSDAQITATVAATAGGDVSVTTPKGTGSLAGFYNGPVITSFSPANGPVGTTVTVTGANFNAAAAANTVYFGAVKAAVSAASAASLTVTVPTGSTFQPLTVTTGGLTAYAGKSFGVTFPSNAAGFAPASFAAKTDFTSATNPSSLYLIDLDGDGKPDMVATNSGGNSISVFKNTSTSETPAFAGKVDFTTGNAPVSVFAADLNGDGKPDLAVTNASANTVSIFRNTSAGGAISFAPKADYVTATLPRGIAIADLNGDGKPDLAVTNGGYNINTVSVFKNTGTSGGISFAEKVDFTAAGSPSGIAIADVDGDGKPDLAVSNTGAYSVSVFRNTGAGGGISFAAKIDYPTAGYVIGFAVGDLDGDGKPDIAAADYNSNTLSLLRNLSTTGTVSFAAKVDYTGLADPRSVAITDLDGDGKPELAVGNNSNGTVSVLRNGSSAGTLVFAAKVDYGVGTNPYGVAIGDLDGDGKPDMATANYGSNNVSVLRNQLAVPALCAGGSVFYTSNLLGASYQWQVKAGTVFTNISNNGNYIGVNTATLQLSNLPSAWYGYQYRCVVDGENSSTYTLQFTNTWVGSASTAWENAANWSCGTVPDGNVDVVIGSGAVVISSAAVCRSIKLSPAATVTVASGYTLSVAQ